MSSSDPGLIAIHYFRKLDVDIIGKDKTCAQTKRFYSLLNNLLAEFGISPSFSDRASLQGRASFLGEGENNRWNIKAFELEDDVVLIAKFKAAVQRTLVERLRSRSDVASFEFFYRDDLQTILHDHVSQEPVSPIWQELLSLSPSTQQTMLFDIPTGKSENCVSVVNQFGSMRPIFPGCVFSQIGDGPVRIGRIAQPVTKARHRREYLLAIYPNDPNANTEFTHLAWAPFGEDALPHLVRFLCAVTRCSFTYGSAMAEKRRLEELQMLLMNRPSTESDTDASRPSLPGIQQKVLELIRSPAKNATDNSNHDLAAVDDQLDQMISGEVFNEATLSLPLLSRYYETFETWRQDAMTLLGGHDESRNRLSFFRSEFVKLEGYRLRIQSAIGYTRANAEVIERGLRSIDSLMSSLSLRMTERRTEAEEQLANRFHLLEVFVVGFYTIYLAYMLHSWSHDDLKTASTIALAFFIVTSLLLLLVQVTSRRLITWNTLLMLSIVFFSCIFAFVLVGTIDVGWNEMWRFLLNLVFVRNK